MSACFSASAALSVSSPASPGPAPTNMILPLLIINLYTLPPALQARSFGAYLPIPVLGQGLCHHMKKCSAHLANAHAGCAQRLTVGIPRLAQRFRCVLLYDAGIMEFVAAHQRTVWHFEQPVAQMQLSLGK